MSPKTGNTRKKIELGKTDFSAFDQLAAKTEVEGRGQRIPKEAPQERPQLAAVPAPSEAALASHRPEPAAVTSSEAKASPEKKRKRTPKRNVVMGERLVAYVEPSLADELRILCVKKRCSVSYAVEEALKAYVKKNSR